VTAQGERHLPRTCSASSALLFLPHFFAPGSTPGFDMLGDSTRFSTRLDHTVACAIALGRYCSIKGGCRFAVASLQPGLHSRGMADSDLSCGAASTSIGITQPR
jgi:hypothetical protein